MPVIAAIVKCKKCGAEVRSDWEFFPNCADKITCTGKYEACARNPDRVGIKVGGSN